MKEINEMFSDPITITLYGDNILREAVKNEIIVDEESLPLKDRCIFGDTHYGFSLVNKKTGEVKEYPTQCKIYGISMEDETIKVEDEDDKKGIRIIKCIKVYEEGKFLPWKFDLNGNLISCATFLSVSRRDLQYLHEHFEADPNDRNAATQVNNYQYKYLLQNKENQSN